MADYSNTSEMAWLQFVKKKAEYRNFTYTTIFLPYIYCLALIMGEAILFIIKEDYMEVFGFLMFGNLIRECGVMQSISETAQNALANLITIFLGITIASQMKAADFLQLDTLIIIGLILALVKAKIGG